MDGLGNYESQTPDPYVRPVFPGARKSRSWWDGAGRASITQPGELPWHWIPCVTFGGEPLFEPDGCIRNKATTASGGENCRLLLTDIPRIQELRFPPIDDGVQQLRRRFVAFAGDLRADRDRA